MDFGYIYGISIVIIDPLTNDRDVNICIVTSMQKVLDSLFNLVMFTTFTTPSKDIELMPEVSFVITPSI